MKKERDLDRQEVENIVEALRSEGVACQGHLLVQRIMPGEALVAFAEENKIDEIFVGIRFRSRVGKFIMGSTAQ